MVNSVAERWSGGGAAILLIGAAQSAAAEWSEASTASSGTTFSFDSAHVEILGGDRQVCPKADLSRDASERARSSMTLVSIDCNGSTMRRLSRVRHDNHGKTISSQT